MILKTKRCSLHQMHINFNAWLSLSYIVYVFSFFVCLFVLLADVNIWYIPLLKVQQGFLMKHYKQVEVNCVHPPL